MEDLNNATGEQQVKNVKDFISEISHCKNSQERLVVTERYLGKKMSPFTKGGVRDPANSPFKVACLSGDYKTAEKMLDFVNEMEDSVRKRKLLDELDEVLKGPYKDGSTLLHCVLRASRCKAGVVELLLENGALKYINEVDADNRPAIYYAYGRNNETHTTDELVSLIERIAREKGVVLEQGNLNLSNTLRDHGNVVSSEGMPRTSNVVERQDSVMTEVSMTRPRVVVPEEDTPARKKMRLSYLVN